MSTTSIFLSLFVVTVMGFPSPVVDDGGVSALNQSVGKRDNPVITTTCGGFLYEPEDLQAAYDAMVRFRNSNPNGPGLRSVHNNYFPHQFGNIEDLPNLQYCQDGSGTYYSWPLLQNRLVFGPNDNEGPDRVVLVETTGGIRMYCGAMTHTGAPTRNGFVRCT